MSAQAPPGIPAQALDALQNSNALIDPSALQQLTTLLAGTPNGTALMALLLDAARGALASAIREGFFVVLAASVLAVGCSLFMANLRLGANIPPTTDSAATPALVSGAVGHGV